MRGFTLIEVLVALVVASVAGAAVAASGRALLAARRGDERALAAALLAAARMESVRARRAALADGVSVEPVVTADGRFEVRTAVGPGPAESLWHVRVDVADARGTAAALETLLRRMP